MGNDISFSYKVASANQYVVKTGFKIDNLHVSKATLKLPFQKAEFIDVNCKNYEFNLHAMTIEKLEFILPGVFTIGPDIMTGDTDIDKLNISKFATLLDTNLNEKENSKKISETILGIIEGETRILAASMKIEEIFNNRSEFKNKIIINIQKELEQFGLKVFNANVKELQDTPGSEYFVNMRQKTKEGAVTQGKIDVADAKMRGIIGETERDSTSRTTVADINARTISIENEKNTDVLQSNAKLAKMKADAERDVGIAMAQKECAIEKTRIDLMKEVETSRQQTQIEKLRSEKLSATIVDAEAMIKKAEAEATAIKLKADAELYKKTQDALAIQKMLEAQSEGIASVASSFKGDNNAMIQYFMLEKGTFVDLAKQNAEAVKGLNPKINVWTTGEQSSSSDPYGTIRNIFQSIPSSLSALKDQTGIELPKWLVNMPQNEETCSLDNSSTVAVRNK